MNESDAAGTIALINFIITMAFGYLVLWLIKGVCKEAVREVLKEEKLTVVDEKS